MLKSMTRYLTKGLTLDDRTHAYIDKRLERLAKLVDPVSRFEVEVDRDKKGKFRVEVMLETPHNLYRAEETSVSVEGSVDVVVDELETQLAKNKTKSRDLKRRGQRSLKKKTVLDKAARF